MNETDYDRGLDKAMKLLAVRSRSRQEIADRLQRAGFDAHVTALVQQRLEELEILDDLTFALELAEQASARGRAPAAIRRELMSKGVPRGTIDEAVDRVCGGGSGLEQALELGRRRARSYGSLPGQVARRRLAGFLARKGYAPDVVFEVCRTVLAEDDRT